jgi:glycosyltransferase involved in cell wall biosynthesis
MEYPRITVVTPSFNQARFLEETIRSVVGQQYPNLEYMVIDAGSKDGSVDIIRRYEKQLAYWVSESDRGPADALNKGFQRATGSILAYLNSDDVYRPGTLQEIAEAFAANRNADVIYGNTYWTDGDGNVLAEKRQTPFSKLGYLYGGSDLQQPATFWKRELHERAGALDVSFRAAFDMDLFFRFVSLGARFEHLPKFLAAYRIHADQISDVLWTTAQKEVEIIRARYLPHPVRSLRGKLLRNFGRIQRILWYVRQGDLPWLIGRIPDRMKSRQANVPAGPKSKWI